MERHHTTIFICLLAIAAIAVPALAQSGFPLKGTCLDIYSRCINTQQELPRVLEQWFPWCLEHQSRLGELFNLYTETKERQRVLDFDDLLLFWNALAADESGARVFRQQFSQIGRAHV